MKYTLKNDYLTATFSPLGAELISLCDLEGTEYIWDANPDYWKRHAPILFPKVGKVLTGTYCAKNKTYQMGQHGFARDFNFVHTSQTDSSILFTLSANKDTLNFYPFDFILEVLYTLKTNTLSITYNVINKENEPISFSIGAHPGFMCPFYKDETMEDYTLSFDHVQNAKQFRVTPEGYLTAIASPLSVKDFNLTQKLFENDAIVLTNLSQHSITLGSKNHSKKIKVSFENFPYLGIWSLPTGAPFVCIEPWFGHTDFLDDSTEFTLKKDHILLTAKDTFTCTHSISVIGS